MEYTTPVAHMEAFAANEYVAACWSIDCNVPYGTGYYETNGKDGYQEDNWYSDGDDFIASGYGCGTTHAVSGIDAAGPSANAMWQDRNGNYYPVFYFKMRSAGNLSDHFCTLDEVVWAPNPNASN